MDLDTVQILIDPEVHVIDSSAVQCLSPPLTPHLDDYAQEL